MEKNTVNHSAHSTWRCQYHIVFAPKYRRKVIYEKHLQKSLCDVNSGCSQSQVLISNSGLLKTKIRPTGKICIPRQDSLEKQIREMLEWL